MSDVARVAVIAFPGSCDDRDACRAVTAMGGEAVLVHHRSEDLAGAAAVIIPGGFSYGDYLRPGALARFAPVMAAVADFAGTGGPVLGICNGFQVLCEAGLLPGVLQPNHAGRFVCCDVDLVLQREDDRWLGGLGRGERLRIPVKHHDGAWYAPPDLAAAVEANGQVLLRYAENPNGSLDAVAGVVNEAGNVLGLMPHPEHAVDDVVGPVGGRPLLAGLLAQARAGAPAAA
jgi:phosphoribosylformylglycinamidine synthase